MDFSFLCMDELDQVQIAGCLGTNGVSHTYIDTLLNGFYNTAVLSISSLFLAIIVGVFFGTLRTLPPTNFFTRLLRGIARIWVEVTRNIPLLVQVFIWYFVVPKIYPPAMQFPALLLVIFALGFFTSARIAEQVRSGIETIPTGQRYAAQAMGFTTIQTYRYVLIPRAMRTIFPPLISESMGIVKNSAIAFAVSIPELMNFQYQAIEEVSHVYENYLVVTLLYVFIAFAIFIVMSFIERMIKVPGFQTEGH